MVSRMKFIADGTAVAVLIALLAMAAPAQAADPVYPTGSRIGLVPPRGMVPSKTFQGFEDRNDKAAIFITALPAAAYAEIEKSPSADALKKQGITVEKREPVQLTNGKGFLIIGKLTADNKTYRKWLLVAAMGDLTAIVSVQLPEQDRTYPDNVVRAALDTLSVRATVPDAEQLSLLPFKVGDLSGFHVENVLPGRALVLVDAPKNPDPGALKDAQNIDFDARLLVAAVPGGPAEGGRSRPNLRGWLSTTSAASRMSRSRCPNRCASTTNLDFRPWRRPRTPATAPTSWWCNGCASAPADSCR